MNCVNSVLHGKNIKLVYYLKNLWRYVVPKWTFRARLTQTLASLDRRPDKGYILDRVDYYNKLRPLAQLPDGLRPLGEHRLKGGEMKSVYFFDTYEFTRWFNDDLQWDYLQGDITAVPEKPCVVKSRPIAGNNQNSVLLNLDKVRHFVFLKDEIPFRQKQDKAIFQLEIKHKLKRERFMKLHFGSKLCDAGIIAPLPEYPKEWTKPKISLYDHLVYKFVLAIEGNDVATNLKWIMSSNSVAVMPRPTYETWFMEGRLIPNYHYIEIRQDYSDMEERLQYYIDHPEEAEAIIDHAHEYIRQFWNPRREKLISLLVLDKYFRQTGQER